jgi:Tol biopolymer transport system component
LNPCFDEKGEMIYFSSTRNSPQPSLWRIASTGGGGITKISIAQSEDFEPSVAAALVFFTSNTPNAEYSQIWSVRKDGSLPTQLREGKNPDVAPDGKHIAFVKEDPRNGRHQIWVMDVDGGNETLLSSDEGADDREPRWSPDGKRLAFTSNAGRDSQQRPNLDIWVMDANGANRTQLTTNGSQDDKPRWDASGKHIYFRSTRGGTSNIWRFEMTASAGEK